MASMGDTSPEQVGIKVKTLINNQLKQVLKKEGLPVSGAKAALQTRIIDRLRIHAGNNDFEAFNRLRSLVYDPESQGASSSPSPLVVRTYPNAPLPIHNAYPHPVTNSQLRPAMTNTPAAYSGNGPKAPHFKFSPFYSIIESLTPLIECKVRDSTRDTVDEYITLRAANAAQLGSNPNLRVMIYCAAETIPFPPQVEVDIEFPYQLEIRINQDEVKANFRGLKNKLGTTRPADVTHMVRHRAGYQNHMVVTYALTKKRYFMVVNLVERHPIQHLITKLQSGKTISKEQVIREMISRAEDTDIVATSSVMSLKCPLSTLRIDVPCRSSVCSHNQCFDASSFLQLQEQAPTWTCPVCNKAVGYQSLLVDQYVDNILRLTPKPVDQVIIEPDGKWSQTSCPVSSSPTTVNGQRNSEDGDDLGDLVEIQNMPRLATVKSEVPRESGLMNTPFLSSREQSKSSAILPSSSSHKRSVGQVVDLTLSSEDDDEPPRAAKRQATLKASSNVLKCPALNSAPGGPNAVNGVYARQPLANPFTDSNYNSNASGHL